MEGVSQIPNWLGTALLGAVIAAAGYVAKLRLIYNARFVIV